MSWHNSNSRRDGGLIPRDGRDPCPSASYCVVGPEPCMLTSQMSIPISLL